MVHLLRYLDPLSSQHQLQKTLSELDPSVTCHNKICCLGGSLLNYANITAFTENINVTLSIENINATLITESSNVAPSTDYQRSLTCVNTL